MKAPSQHIPSDPRLSQAWNDGWNGQGIDPFNNGGSIPFYSMDQEMQAAYEQGLTDANADAAFNAAIWRDTPKDRFGNYIY